MYRKVTNPIAIQSQKQICETMLQLLTSIPFDEITITQLCEEAHLVRKTFYRNFETKEDVLICMLDYHLLEYIQELNQHTQSMEELSRHFFTFWQSKYNYLKTLQENALFYLLNRLYLHYIEEIQTILSNSPLEQFHDNNAYSFVFFIGGLCNLFAYWISRECKETVDDLILLSLKYK